MQKKIIRVFLVTAALLLIPLTAAIVKPEGFNWTFFDFVFAAVLLSGTGLLYEFVAQKANSAAYKMGVAMGVGTAFLLVWVNGAVGIIGSEDNPANVMYFGVLIIGMIGVFLSNFEPRRLSNAMVAVAASQMIVPVLAYLFFRPFVSTPGELMGVAFVFGINVFFALLWAGSALMFKRASMPAQLA
jgi:hypothetical protein